MPTIEYEFFEPDHIMILDPETLFAEHLPISKENPKKDPITFRKFLNSDKMLWSWDGKPVMATKKLKTRVYFLTKDWMVYEVRFE